MRLSCGWRPTNDRHCRTPSRHDLPSPQVDVGLLGWVTTVDHKKIGIMYGYAAFFFFLVGRCRRRFSFGSSSPRRTVSF